MAVPAHLSDDKTKHDGRLWGETRTTFEPIGLGLVELRRFVARKIELMHALQIEPKLRTCS